MQTIAKRMRSLVFVVFPREFERELRLVAGYPRQPFSCHLKCDRIYQNVENAIGRAIPRFSKHEMEFAVDELHDTGNIPAHSLFYRLPDCVTASDFSERYVENTAVSYADE